MPNLENKKKTQMFKCEKILLLLFQLSLCFRFWFYLHTGMSFFTYWFRIQPLIMLYADPKIWNTAMDVPMSRIFCV